MFKDTNKSTILFSAIFLILGYLLGSNANCEETCERYYASSKECCAPTPPPPPGCKSAWSGDSDGDGVQVIVEQILDGGFQGDTAFAVPGGEAVIHVDGDEVRVEVNIEDEHTH